MSATGLAPDHIRDLDEEMLNAIMDLKRRVKTIEDAVEKGLEILEARAGKRMP